ncbi:CsgG/HfaB family protein [Celeribacter indicus]|uniref:Curli production assembly/transport component CsgG n=1 Tax=Celeribacter indicus TaxID=1208324 RepID=A0A0B5E5I7_9RHOB|nr:CsgG/HfaB family protein [Celeribacter indicus]AJE48645.1 curli production assembly/transport component CsgG [Celeribacter indicus]SDX34823.1 curli production assembly/transport component CsgG/holdfast attachment protein HfaB [Celeribacter indicus]
MKQLQKTPRSRALLAAVLAGGMGLSACSPAIDTTDRIVPLLGPPVTDNATPYTACLFALAASPSQNRPTFAVGQVSDKTGKRAYDSLNDSTELTQGVSEMVISALFKTRQVNLAERLDPRVALAEQQLVAQNLIKRPAGVVNVAPAHFVVLGALTELNYNIHSGGERLHIAGIGGGRRAAVINVGLDLRLVDMQSFGTVYVTSLQKQIVGIEHEAGIFRFFDDRFVEFDSGNIRNEPLQLGVRSVVELAVYQILTEGLGLPAQRTEGCTPGGEYPRQPDETQT